MIPNIKRDDYSTEEIIVGKDYDGQPVYRKVIFYNQYILKDTLIAIPHNIQNLGEVIKCDAMMKWNNTNYPFPTHYQNQTNEIVVNSIDATNINITSYGENWGDYIIRFTLEYKKN